MFHLQLGPAEAPRKGSRVIVKDRWQPPTLWTTRILLGALLIYYLNTATDDYGEHLLPLPYPKLQFVPHLPQRALDMLLLITLALCALLVLYCLVVVLWRRHKVGILRVGAALVALIYFAGCSVLNQAVADGCTHGNCIHGWYSKYNEPEKAIFLLWALGFPVLVGATYMRVTEPQRMATRAANLAIQRELDLARARSAINSARARKSWSCALCQRVIASGETYWYNKDRYRGSVDRRYCGTCRGSPAPEPNPAS